MLEDIKSRNKISQCIIDNARKLISSMLTEEVNFSIFCYINNVDFDPPIPENISVNLKSLTIFALSGYTFTTAKLDKTKIVFEAGFGEENFSSVVSVPLKDILQVLIAENVIFVNPFSDGESDEKKDDSENELAVSMEAILSNPKNKNIFKK